MESDPAIQEVAHRNYSVIQDKLDDMLAGRTIQIDNVKFAMRLKAAVLQKPDALGFALIGKDGRGKWLPAHELETG